MIPTCVTSQIWGEKKNPNIILAITQQKKTFIYVAQIMKLIFIFSIEQFYIKPCQAQNGSSLLKFNFFIILLSNFTQNHAKHKTLEEIWK